ncbi:hypothetical protein ACA910_000207 [Epithemia clementina (nom. ined.)]
MFMIGTRAARFIPTLHGKAPQLFASLGAHVLKPQNMSFVGTRASSSRPTFHRAARKLLGYYGVLAMKPRLVQKDDGRELWRAPKVSRRRARVLRNEAIRNGTYGTFDKKALTGWERSWDIEMAISKPRGEGRFFIRPSKTTKRERTREQRALKIEKAMEGMDDRIEEFYAQRIANKPVKNFEYRYKSMIKRLKKNGSVKNYNRNIYKGVKMLQVNFDGTESWESTKRRK